MTGFLRRLFRRSFQKGVRVIDLRTPKEQSAETIGYSNKSLGAEADALIGELVEIARTTGIWSSSERDTPVYDEFGYYKRAKEIGSRLNQLGGKRNGVKSTFDHWR